MIKNKIPRKFNRITAKIKINTNMDEIGDILHIFRNNFGFLGLNLRTGKYAYYFASMIRNGDIFEFLEVC